MEFSEDSFQSEVVSRHFKYSILIKIILYILLFSYYNLF